MIYKFFNRYFVKKQLNTLINQNLTTRSYVFLKADRRWLNWLYKKGFLNVIAKEAKETEKTRYDLPEMSYLVRMSKVEPDNVTDILVKIIAEIPKNNIRYEVFMGILEICTKIPPAQLSILLEAIYSTKWIPLFSNDDHSISSIRFESIFKILADAKYNKELLRLAEKLLKVKKKEEIKKQYKDLPSDDAFCYGDLAATGIFQSLIKIPNNYVEHTFDLTTKVMRNIIKLSDKSYAEKTFPICDNYNFITSDFFELEIDSVDSWRNENNQIRIGAIIVSLARKLFDESSVSKEDALAYYEKYIGDFDDPQARLPDNQTMWHLRLFILSLAPNFFQDKLQKLFWRLFKVEYYYDISAGTEYKKTLKKCFGYLSQDYQTNYVNKFLSYFSSLIGGAKSEKDITEEEKKSGYISKEHHRHILSPIISMIASLITDEQKQEMKEIGLKIISNYEPDPIVKTWDAKWTVTRGPITEELFAKLSISDIVAKLCNEWSLKALHDKYKISDEGSFINEGGVSNLLEKNMPKRLQEYINEANSFFAPEKIDLFYTSAYLLGLRATILKTPLLALECDWAPVIELCYSIKDFDIQEPLKKKQVITSYYVTNGALEYKGLILNTLDFLRSIFSVRNEESVVDLSKYHTKILRLLNDFLMDEDPIAEIITNNSSEFTLDTNKIDPLYATPVRGIRGCVLEVLISFIQMDITMKRTYMSDDIREEIRTLYKKAIKEEHNRSVMFLFGRYINVIYYWDREFLLSNINLMFSMENKKKHLYAAVWEGFLSGPFIDKIFFESKIQGIYFRGAQLKEVDYPLGKHFRDPDELIAKRIAWAFVVFYEDFGFDHRLFKAFLESNNLKRYSEFIRYIGREFISNKGKSPDNKRKRDFLQDTPEVKEKLCKFWDWMLKNCKHSEPFVEFGNWLSTEDNIFEDKWLASTLVKTVEKTSGDLSWYDLHIVVAKLANKYPIEALQIIRSCLLGDATNDEIGGFKIYIDASMWTKTFEEIYNNPAIKIEVKEKADNLISELIENRGNPFRPLKKFIK